MSGRVVIDFTVAEGAVIRMLGLVERRGFQLRGIAMAETGERASMTLDVDPRDSGRCFDVLDRQLRRLHGVHDVSTTLLKSGSAS
jgi:acetolactate synthase-1/3 small subunit/acetolactate synthase II small subunit